MISYLSGIVNHIGPAWVEVLAGGVGYRVLCTPDTCSRAVARQPIELFIHTHVREDALDLFGFDSRPQLELFEKLITVSSIGPKTALNVLTLASPDEIESAIIRGDAAVLTKVSGIGKKTAERIVLELSGKIVSRTADTTRPVADSDAEVIDALVGLGYTIVDARSLVSALPADCIGTDARIKAALKSLAK